MAVCASRELRRALSQRNAGTGADPVRLEIFNGLFMAIAEEMGSALARSATSVNIRERLDFSCAVFDSAGRLVANAPHMPVHLGSMGESVQTVHARALGREGWPGRAARRCLCAQRALCRGHAPARYHRGHAGVRQRRGTVPDFWVAARGHHADVGGIAPGSMPPNSCSIEEEGVLLDNVLLVDEGRFSRSGAARAAVQRALSVAQCRDEPRRSIRAGRGLRTRRRQGWSAPATITARAVVNAYMDHVHANAEEAVRRLIGRLEDGAFRYEMDNGAVIAVAVRVDRAARHVTIDFAGSSDQLPGNFNAPFSVVRAAVMYVLRTMIDDPIPMNEGCLAPVTILVPEGSMLRPRYPAAVVAGNVETSQAVTDALFGAFGAMAAAQGTMNNFTFGNDRISVLRNHRGRIGRGAGF